MTVLPPSSLHPEDGGSMAFQKLVSYHITTASQSRRPQLEGYSHYVTPQCQWKTCSQRSTNGWTFIPVYHTWTFKWLWDAMC